MRINKVIAFLISSARNFYDLDFWLPFNDIDSSPLENPYQSYTGQFMDVTQTGSNLSVSGGLLLKAGAGIIGSSLMKSQDSTERVRGKCIAFRFKYTGSTGAVLIGYDQPGASGFAHGFQVSSNSLLSVDRFSGAALGVTLTSDTWYHAFIVLRDNGAYFIINIEADHYLVYVSSRWSFADVHRYLSLGGTASIDWVREKELEGAFITSDWGLATESVTTPIAGSAFTHGASGWIVFFIQTKTTSGSIDLRFRRDDASNYLKLTIDSTNIGRLYQVVAGVETQLGSNATLGQSAEYRIMLNGSSIRIFGDASTALLISGTSSSFVNESSGELVSEGTGGNISYIQCLPLGLTDINVLSELEGIIAISDPPTSGADQHVSIYASTTGTGDGTEGNPYSIENALNALEPGTTLWLSGGTYSNVSMNLDSSGISANPIYIKPKPGEHAIIDSVDDFIITGTDVILDGKGGILEIFCDSWTGDRFLTSQAFDFSIFGARCKILNCVIHDFGNNGLWSIATDAEFIGNLVYNIGRGNGSQGHPLYTQNNVGTKLIESNMFIQTFESTFTIHQYGSGSSTLKGYEYNKNICINGRWLTGAAGSTIEDLLIDDNICYPYRIEIGQLGAADQLHNDFHIINNRFSDITVKKGTNFTILNNTVIGTTQLVMVINNVEGTYQIENNDYIFHGGAIPFNKLQHNAVSYPTLAGWQGAGFDLNGSLTQYPISLPPNYQRVMTNRLDPERAGVWVENYDQSATVDIDLSELTGLVNGTSYRLYNAQNFAEYHEFVHNGSPVTVSMLEADWSVSIPIGTEGGVMATIPNLFPLHGAFYLMKAI